MKKKFPTLYSIAKTQSKHKDIWEAELDFLDEEDLLKIIDVLQLEQILAQGTSPDDFLEICEITYSDIINLKTLNYNPNEQIILSYLQLLVGVNAVGYFNMKGMFHYSFDWINNSILDKKIISGDDVDYSTDTFIDLLDSKLPVLTEDAPSLVVTWLKELYYYSRAYGGHFGLAEFLLPFALQIGLRFNNDFDDNLELLLQLSPWANDNGNIEATSIIDNYLMGIADTLKITDTPIAKTIRNVKYYLAINNKIPLDKRKTYYNEIKEYSRFNAHERQQIASELYIFTKEEAFHNELKTGLLEYINFLQSRNLNVVEKSFEKSRIFRTIINSIIYLVNTEQISKLSNALATYYEGDPLKGLECLFIIPNHQSGVLYSSIKGTVITRHDTRKEFPKLYELHNLLLNQLGIIKGKGDYVPKIPQRDLGFPNYKMGKAFEDFAQKFYNFKNISPFLEDNVIKSLCQIEFNNAPIQSLMLKSIQKTLPITVTFNNPLEDRTIRRVLIWAFGTNTSEYEASVLQTLFSTCGREVVVIKQEEMNKELFLKTYNSKDYDVIWLATHGEFKPYEPHKSVIYISSEQTIELSDLVSMSLDADKRRLLVLNMCESGMNADMGGIQSIGLGHLLTTKKQAVISHLWSIDPRVALAFAFLIANELNLNNNYFNSFCSAILEMIKGRTNILALMTEKIPSMIEIINRIRNGDNIDWENILNWGSGVFTE
jgi:hypothetical protein